MARRDDWIAEDIVFEDDRSRALRPFLVTGGRTTTDTDLEYETLVEATGAAVREPLRFESAQVVARCTEPLSVAEISAHLSIPLGSALVLVGDLVEAGHLLSHHTHNAESDAGFSLVTRIIAGVKQL
ncbi:MAG: DUF742 domain-containing protein [Actinomycetota bacterium]